MPFGYRDESEHRSPGWYADAQRPGQERWWNGVAWSESRRPAGGGPIVSVSGPTAEAIPVAATPRNTMAGLAGERAPRPAARSVSEMPMRSGDPAAARAVPALVVGVLGLAAGLVGFLWLPLVALGLALSSRKAARRAGLPTTASSVGIALAAAGLALFLLVSVAPALREGVLSFLSGLVR